MAVISVADISDPRLDVYRGIRWRNWTRHSGFFIAEGPLLVERLLDSRYDVHSVLIDRKYVGHYQSLVPPEIDLFVVDHSEVEHLVGFNFHRGVLACGIRPAEQSIVEFNRLEFSAAETLLAAVGVQDPENLGGILRSCSAFGVRHVIVGPGTADPLARRVLRVSMGNALRLNLYRSEDFLRDLDEIRLTAMVETFATSLDADSRPLESIQRQRASLVIVGNERYGLPDEVLKRVDRRIRIDMSLGTDSLNVSVATGVVLYHFCRIA